MKQFVKTNIIQIIGLTLTLVGFFLSGVKFTQVSESPSRVFTNIYVTLVFIGIAVYAVIQLIRLQAVGRKLAVIWFSWMLLVAIVNMLTNYFLDASFSFLNPLNSKYPILTASFYLFGLISLNQLHDEEVIGQMSKDDGLARRIAKILAVGIPGLGRALTGNMPLGIALCLCFIYIMRIVLLQQDTISMLFFGVMIWSIFASIDLAAVKKAVEMEQLENSLSESGLQ